MKASITTDGRLVVTPENETEDWMEYFPQNERDHEMLANPTALQINSWSAVSQPLTASAGN